jgi:hypothetical protein
MQVGGGAGPGGTTSVLGCLPFPLHDFRTILTFIARMPQMARDICAIVFLVHTLKGDMLVAGHARDTFGTIIGGPLRR